LQVHGASHKLVEVEEVVVLLVAVTTEEDLQAGQC
jgi:hypothetical protein